MFRKSLGFGLIAALLISLGSGCKKAPSEDASPKSPPNAVAPTSPRPDTVFRLRWLGTRRLMAETNVAGFVALWNLPETQTLKAQTLDRLALALTDGAAATNIASAPSTNAVALTNSSALRPILEDLISEESYWEIQQIPGKAGELAFAIRLNEERVKLWQTNLAAVLGAMAPSVSPTGTIVGQWQLTRWLGNLMGGSPGPHALELIRAGNWTVVGPASGSNGLTRQLAGRIPDQAVPAYVGTTNSWLKADLNLSRVDEAMALGWKLPQDLPAIFLTVSGDSDGVRTHAQLDFPKPLPDNLTPWNVPTNLIHDPLVSFTAVRGVGSWLSSLESWKKLDVGSAPEQVYFWAQGGLPFISYCAAPFPNASNVVEGLTRDLMKANPWIETNGLGRFERSTNFDGVIWSNLTIVTPYVRLVPLPQGSFVYAGLESDIRTNRSVPPELLGALFARTNLVAYDWELTGPRVEQWLYFGQFVRFAVHLAQIPPKSASFAWLTAMTPHLGNCATVVTKTGPSQLIIGRKSDTGFTSAELDFLADWLESPQFPRGLNTFQGLPAALPPKLSTVRGGRSHTNSVSAPQH